MTRCSPDREFRQRLAWANQRSLAVRLNALLNGSLGKRGLTQARGIEPGPRLPSRARYQLRVLKHLEAFADGLFQLGHVLGAVRDLLQQPDLDLQDVDPAVRATALRSTRAETGMSSIASSAGESAARRSAAALAASSCAALASFFPNNGDTGAKSTQCGGPRAELHDPLFSCKNPRGKSAARREHRHGPRHDDPRTAPPER